MRSVERTGAIRYGLLEEGDVAEARALINLVQPHAPWSSEHFDWQFRASPAGHATIFAAWEGPRLIGLYCAAPAVLQLRGAVAKAARVQDVMTHPDWRGRGVLHALAEICRDWMRERAIRGYAFPNERSQGSFLRLGWDGTLRVPWWTSPIDAADARDESIAVSCAAYDARATAIWEAAEIDHAIRRDAAYLNWRYSKPRSRYEKLILRDDTVLVLKQYESTVHVCDLFAPADRAGAVADALRFARGWGARRGARRLTAWLPCDHRDAPQFEEAGMTWEANVARVVVTLDERLHYVSHSDNDIY